MVTFRLQHMLPELRDFLSQRGFFEKAVKKSRHPTEKIRYEKRGSLYGIEVGLDEEFFDEAETDHRALIFDFDYKIPSTVISMDQGELIVPDARLLTYIFQQQHLGFNFVAFPGSNPRTEHFCANYEMGLSSAYDNVTNASLVTAQFIDYVANTITLNCDTARGLRNRLVPVDGI